MTPLERAGKAAHEALSRANVIAYLDMPEETANEVARAVIAAIREPSEGMMKAGEQGLSFHEVDVWDRMIDALLAEGE